jgi:hypothetical protein
MCMVAHYRVQTNGILALLQVFQGLGCDTGFLFQYSPSHSDEFQSAK